MGVRVSIILFHTKPVQDCQCCQCTCCNAGDLVLVELTTERVSRQCIRSGQYSICRVVSPPKASVAILVIRLRVRTLHGCEAVIIMSGLYRVPSFVRPLNVSDSILVIWLLLRLLHWEMSQQPSISGQYRNVSSVEFVNVFAAILAIRLLLSSLDWV